MTFYPDLVCGDDLDLFGSETTSELDNLVQDVQHVLLETLGSNLDDPARGVGIFTYLSGTSDQLLGLPGIIEAQLLQDDRIAQCVCTVTLQSGDDTMYDIVVQIAVDGNQVSLSFSWDSAGNLVFNGAS